MKYEIRCSRTDCEAHYKLDGGEFQIKPLFCAFCGGKNISVIRIDEKNPEERKPTSPMSLGDLNAMNTAQLADYVINTQDLSVQCFFAGNMPQHYFQMLSRSERLQQISDAIDEMPKETLAGFLNKITEGI